MRQTNNNGQKNDDDQLVLVLQKDVKLEIVCRSIDIHNDSK